MQAAKAGFVVTVGRLCASRRWAARCLLATLLVAASSRAEAQSLRDRVRNASADAEVFFRFESRPDVCGAGEDIIVRDGRGGDGITTIQHRRGATYNRNTRDRLLDDCRTGPATVELTRDGGRITYARLTVASSDPPTGRDLGTVTPAEAVAYLLDDAVTNADARAADKLVLAAVVANAESWPALLRLARQRELAQATRTSAIFWLAQQAGDKATEGLTSLIGDNSEELEVRKTAVFALSQVQSEETLNQLMRIARTNREPEIRRNAMFWLGHSRDPRVLAFFEEILKGG